MMEAVEPFLRRVEEKRAIKPIRMRPVSLDPRYAEH